MILSYFINGTSWHVKAEWGRYVGIVLYVLLVGDGSVPVPSVECHILRCFLLLTMARNINAKARKNLLKMGTT